MQFTSTDAERRYAALVRAASDTVVGLDFDGTLSPIVDDPARAEIHPDAREVLVGLAGEVRAVAIITGRPARQALELGGLDRIADELDGERTGQELHLYGQYGNERWTSTRREVVGPRPPDGLAGFRRELRAVLSGLDAADAHVEDKGLAVAVHTRRLADPAGAFERLLPALGELAERHGLAVEPGRQVVEVRAPGVHKGQVLELVVQQTGARGVVFAGDDLGDLDAFAAVERLAESGLATLRVCAASAEQPALAARADVVVPGPDGVLDFLRRLTADARTARRS